MSFYTTKAFMLRESNGDLGVELPSDIKELLKQRGLTVVFVSGDVECDGEFVGMNDTMVQLLSSEDKEKKLTDKRINFDTFIAESNELIKKLGDVWAAGIKDIYGKEYRVSDGQWNEEQLAKAKESNTKPYEINKIKPVLTMEEFIKFRDKMARPS